MVEPLEAPPDLDARDVVELDQIPAGRAHLHLEQVRHRRPMLVPEQHPDVDVFIRMRVLEGRGHEAVVGSPKRRPDVLEGEAVQRGPVLVQRHAQLERTLGHVVLDDEDAWGRRQLRLHLAGDLLRERVILGHDADRDGLADARTVTRRHHCEALDRRRVSGLEGGEPLAQTQKDGVRAAPALLRVCEAHERHRVVRAVHLLAVRHEGEAHVGRDVGNVPGGGGELRLDHAHHLVGLPERKVDWRAQ